MLQIIDSRERKSLNLGTLDESRSFQLSTYVSYAIRWITSVLSFGVFDLYRGRLEEVLSNGCTPVASRRELLEYFITELSGTFLIMIVTIALKVHLSAFPIDLNLLVRL